MRNMSFALTTQQIKNRTKDVTRRFGWMFLKKGDVVCAVEKSMGLKRGEKVNRLGLIKIVSVRLEPLSSISAEDVVREGFPDWSPREFIDMMVRKFGCSEHEPINRIEFKYL